jgi:hypothetical protein
MVILFSWVVAPQTGPKTWVGYDHYHMLSKSTGQALNYQNLPNTVPFSHPNPYSPHINSEIQQLP